MGEKSLHWSLRPWRKSRFPAQTEIQHQLTCDAPVILEITCEIRPLLPDETNGIERPAIGITQQKRGEWISARIWVRAIRDAGLCIAESSAAGDALPAIPVVAAPIDYRPPNLNE